MTTYRKIGISQILLFIFALSLSNCVTDDYDLSKGLNTDLTVGGDSLTFPIGETDSITLGSLISDNDSLIKKASDGAYSLSIKDSMQVKIDAINPVSFNIDPISIDPINTSTINVDFPAFQFPSFNLSSAIAIPDISVTELKVPSISSSNKFHQPIPTITPSLVKATTTALRTKSASLADIPTINIVESSTINQSLDFTNNNPNELEKIEKVFFNNNIVTLNLKKIIPAEVTNEVSKINSFKIVFPTEFALSKVSASDPGVVENGNSYVISNYALTSGSDFTVSFYINSVDLSNVAQNPMHYSNDVTYTINYQMSGQVTNENIPALSGQEVSIIVALTNSGIIGDVNIKTKNIKVDLANGTGTNAVNTVVENIPTDISSVNSLTFKGTPQLKLTIDDPTNSALQLESGNCVITFPQSFNYASGSKTLNIPATSLLNSTNYVGITGITLGNLAIDTTVANNHKLSLADELKYDISDLHIKPTSISLNQLKGLNGKSINIKAESSKFEIDNANVTTKRITLDIPAQTTNIDINQSVSTDVKKIYTVTLKTPALLTFKINVSNVPTGVSTIYFDNYKIKMPACLKFKTGDVNANNELLLNEGFNVNSGFTRTLTLEKFDFGTSGNTLTNGVFKLNESVAMTGNVYIKSSTLNSKDIGTITVKPAITIGNMTISVIEGEIKPVMDPVDETVKLDFPSSIKNDSNNLDIKNPVISFEIGNTMGIAVDLPLNLIPKSKGVAIPNATITTTLHIAATNVPGQATYSKFRLSAIPTGITDDYQIVLIPTLTNLLKVIPDEIAISAIPQVAGDKQVVDLYSPKNQIDFKYGVNVPLEFGEKFKLQFNDTIDNLKKDLKDILKYTRNIDILAVVENHIPLNLVFKATPCNSLGKKITGISVGSDSILYDNVNPISFGIKETITGALDELDKFIITVSASKNAATSLIPLKADQYMKLKLKVRLPKGITYNPDSDK